MREIKILPAKNSPEIIMSPNGVIKIKGRSISENVGEFFKPISAWIDEYIEDPAEITCVDMILEYFNSASAKVFIQLLQKLTYVKLKDKKLIFNWYYEDGDDDILERGEYFASVLDIPFNFIRIN
jgi:hypothetical protein